jgi:RNA polymerase sigma factor (sigma-70 family)
MHDDDERDPEIPGTEPRVADAQDAIDRADLDNGRIDRLLARYEPVIVARCIARCKNEHDGRDVAQDVLFRLFREFQNGRRYEGLPYRAVVGMAVKWTLADHFAGKPTDVELPEDFALRDGRYEDSIDQLVDLMGLEQLLSVLPDRPREVATLVWLEGCSHDQAADRLGITRNNVDQALYRARRELLEHVSDYA